MGCQLEQGFLGVYDSLYGGDGMRTFSRGTSSSPPAYLLSCGVFLCTLVFQHYTRALIYIAASDRIIQRTTLVFMLRAVMLTPVAQRAAKLIVSTCSVWHCMYLSLTSIRDAGA